VSGELRVAVKAVDGADLAEEFRGGKAAAAGHLEERWCELLGALLELAVEHGDRLVHRAAADHELASDPHLHDVGLSSELTSDTFEEGGAAELARPDRERRVELVQVPAEPAVHPPPLDNEIIAVINKEFPTSPEPTGRSGQCSPSCSASRSSRRCSSGNNRRELSEPGSAPFAEPGSRPCLSRS